MVGKGFVKDLVLAWAFLLSWYAMPLVHDPLSGAAVAAIIAASTVYFLDRAFRALEKLKDMLENQEEDTGTG